MVNHSSTQIPKPKNWQDFERCSRILFGCIWNDNQAQLNGRPGQRQNGVDIYGRKDGIGDKWLGVQCKGKDSDYGGKVTEKELRAEVAELDNFNPSLSEFTLIATAPVDAKIQEVARIITQERDKEGKPLAVSVWGWGELEAHISQHGLALQAFHPDLTPFTNQIIGGIERLDQGQQQQTALLEKIAGFVAQATQRPNDGDKPLQGFFCISRK